MPTSRRTQAQYRRSAYHDLIGVAEYLLALGKPLPADLQDEMAEAGIIVDEFIAKFSDARDTSINTGFALV